LTCLRTQTVSLATARSAPLGPVLAPVTFLALSPLHSATMTAGEFKKLCTKEAPCHFFGDHRHLRPEKGDERVDEKRGSVYPDELCFLLSTAASRLLGRVRTIDLDPAYTADGTRDKCTGCGGRQRGGDVHTCEGCPDVWHYKCIPNGYPKPKNTNPWFCPNAACQQRRMKQDGA